MPPRPRPWYAAAAHRRERRRDRRRRLHHHRASATDRASENGSTGQAHLVPLDGDRSRPTPPSPRPTAPPGAPTGRHVSVYYLGSAARGATCSTAETVQAGDEAMPHRGPCRALTGARDPDYRTAWGPAETILERLAEARRRRGSSCGAMRARRPKTHVAPGRGRGGAAGDLTLPARPGRRDTKVQFLRNGQPARRRSTASPLTIRWAGTRARRALADEHRLAHGGPSSPSGRSIVTGTNNGVEGDRGHARATRPITTSC